MSFLRRRRRPYQMPDGSWMGVDGVRRTRIEELPDGSYIDLDGRRYGGPLLWSEGIVTAICVLLWPVIAVLYLGLPLWLALLNREMGGDLVWKVLLVLMIPWSIGMAREWKLIVGFFAGWVATVASGPGRLLRRLRGNGATAD